MPRPSRFLRAPLALVAASMVLAACADDDSDDESGETPAAQSPSQTPSEESSAAMALPDGVLALPSVPAGEDPPPLDAGRYQIPLSDTLAFEIDLPQGTMPNNEGLYLVTKAGIIKVEAADEGYGVPGDACKKQDIDPAGPSVQDLVTAITKDPIYRVGAADPVEIGGAQGTHLEIRVPAGYDATGCVDGQVGLPGNPSTSNNMSPGYVGDWWILDVDGQRVVAQQLCEECDAAQRQRIARSVEGMTFTSAS